MASKPDMLSLLGKPDPADPAAPKGAPVGKQTAGYLESKPPELQTYLENAVDPGLTPKARAEALCRAIEFQAGEQEPDADDSGGGDDTGGDEGQY